MSKPTGKFRQHNVVKVRCVHDQLSTMQKKHRNRLLLPENVPADSCWSRKYTGKEFHSDGPAKNLGVAPPMTVISCISISVEQHAINLCMSVTFICIFKVGYTSVQNSLHFTFSCYRLWKTYL